MTAQAEIKPEVKPENTPKEPIAATPEAQPVIKSEENQNNWKMFREQREHERKRLDQESKQRQEAEHRAKQREEEAEALKKALEAVVNKQNTYDEPGESEDARIDKKVKEALAKQRQHDDQERRRREKEELPNNLASTFSDFGQVCSAENLDYLEFHYPEVAAGYKHAPDSFDKWANLYKAVKKFVPNTDSKKDMAKADRNLAKPQSMSAPGTTQGGNAMPGARLDEKKMNDNWARMQRVMKGLS